MVDYPITSDKMPPAYRVLGIAANTAAFIYENPAQQLRAEQAKKRLFDEVLASALKKSLLETKLE
jgi:hypothetical protein